MFPNMKYTDHWSTYRPGTTYNEISHEINIENRGGQPLNHIAVEYCIYHQTTIQERVKNSFYGAGKTVRIQTETGWRDRYDPPAWYSSRDSKYTKRPERTVSNTIKGSFYIQDIPSGEKVQILTDPFKLVKKAEEGTTYPNPPQENKKGTLNKRTIKGNLLGIRCRVYVPTQAGNYAMVEFSSPSSLINRTEWVSPE